MKLSILILVFMFIVLTIAQKTPEGEWSTITRLLKSLPTETNAQDINAPQETNKLIENSNDGLSLDQSLVNGFLSIVLIIFALA